MKKEFYLWFVYMITYVICVGVDFMYVAVCACTCNMKSVYVCINYL